MKTKLLILISLIALSCKKDEIKPNNPQEVCNCGLVVSDNVQDYSVVIRNSCSGNEKRFYLQQGDWMNAHPGSDYCITNITNW
jgi:hypothetical protein